MKRCTKCGELKPVSDFPIRKDRGGKPRSHCRVCHNAAAKTEHSKALQTEWRYLSKYGLTVAEVRAMLLAQGGRCAICRVELTAESQHVDHDHSTGLVRALLCRACNSGLGMFHDRPKLLEAAADFIREHQQATLKRA